MKILVVRFEDRQDVFLLGSFLKRLREEYPMSEIYLMTYEKNHDITSNWDYLDDIIIYHPEKDIFRKWAFVSILRKMTFDIVFDLQNDTKSNLITKLIKKNEVFRVELKRSLHILEDYFNTLKAKIPDAEVETFSQNFPKGFCYRIGKVRPPLLVISPFTDDNNPAWGIERFLYIAGRFNELTGGDVVIVGNLEDEENSKPFFVYDFIYNLPGKADFLQNLWVIKNCSFYLGGSSEYTQAAAGFGKPTIAIFEKSDLIKHYPISDNARVFKGEVVQGVDRVEISGIDEEEVLQKMIDVLYEKDAEKNNNVQHKQ